MTATSTPPKKSIFNSVIEKISLFFTPIIPFFSALGFLKGILVLLTSNSILDKESTNYIILAAIADSAFYFLPILLAYTCAKTLKTNVMTSLVVSCVLLYPTLAEILNSSDLIFLGIPLKSVNYAYGVLPIIASVILVYYSEKLLLKIIPRLLQSILIPLISVFVISTLMLSVFGPLANLISNLLASGYSAAYNFSPNLAGFIFGGLIQPMVALGLHWGLVPVIISNVTTHGYDTILPFFSPPLLATVGATFAVFLKAKNTDFKALALSTTIISFLGVTEPSIYGVNLKLKKPFINICISGAVGGFITGFFDARALAFAFPNILTLPVYLSDGFGGMIVASLISMVIAFLLTMFSKLKDDDMVVTKM